MIRINSVLNILDYIIEKSGETEFLISEDVLSAIRQTFEQGDGVDFDQGSRIEFVQFENIRTGDMIKYSGATFYEVDKEMFDEIEEKYAIKNLV